MAYFGKTVAIEPMLDDLRRAARKEGFSVSLLHEVQGLPILALSRSGNPANRSVYLSAGIHGDEPAGPLAILELLEIGLPRDINWHICPALNPTGLAAGTRTNSAGIDLNRDYLALSQPEVQAHVEWLGSQGIFDMALFLHEDWECNGYYLYELNPNPAKFSAARRILRAVEPHCPVDHADRIDGHEANQGIITPIQRDLRREDWPEAIYVFTHHNRLNYTLESPSAFALHTRVEAHREAVLASVEALSEGLSNR